MTDSLTKETLLPCPFCGNPPEWDPLGYITDDNHFLGCMTKECVAPYVCDTDKPTCASMWNMRTSR